ncbi:MgtC/SapB family protein [Neisseriaceae bacterium JH1-16]|nr:MgtC/SapB family protein [Neisseriaceae bacterium JH1-16]
MTLDVIDNFRPWLLLNTLICLAVAFVLGSIIGYERQYRQRTAGLRTNALVAVGAAVFVDLAGRLAGPDGATRVVAYVVSGVGFLGAGAIMKEGLNVRGLNTAATLWGSAAAGACAGASLLGEAILAAVFVLSANTLLRPLANAINRRPIDDAASELTYILCVIASRAEQKTALAAMEAMLETANYPVADLDVLPFGDDDVEINATLQATSVDSGELDRIVGLLVSHDFVSQAFWNPSTTE